MNQIFNTGNYNISHLKSGILVYSQGKLLGLVVFNQRGFGIRDTTDAFLGGEQTIRELITKFHYCKFYLL